MSDIDIYIFAYKIASVQLRFHMYIETLKPEVHATVVIWMCLRESSIAYGNYPTDISGPIVWE